MQRGIPKVQYSCLFPAHSCVDRSPQPVSEERATRGTVRCWNIWGLLRVTVYKIRMSNASKVIISGWNVILTGSGLNPLQICSRDLRNTKVPRCWCKHIWLTPKRRNDKFLLFLFLFIFIPQTVYYIFCNLNSLKQRTVWGGEIQNPLFCITFKLFFKYWNVYV